MTAALHKAIIEAAEKEGESVGKFITETLEMRIRGDK